MKKILISIFILASLSLSATHEHLTLSCSTNEQTYTYCNTIDTVIIYKPLSFDTIQDCVWRRSVPLGYEYQYGDSMIYINNGLSGHVICYNNNGGQVYRFNIAFTAPIASCNITVHQRLGEYIIIGYYEYIPYNDSMKCPETILKFKAITTGGSSGSFIWNTQGNGNETIATTIPGTYSVTATNVCGISFSDSVTIYNYVPSIHLGPDIISCNGNTVLLTGGDFTSYHWNTGDTTQEISVDTSGIYYVGIVDTNGCIQNDTIAIDFVINDGEEIFLLTIDTISGYNKITWETEGSTDVTTNIYREVSTDTYELIGNTAYINGSWTDTVSSTNQTWRYKISTIDTCGNESVQSPYHQTISTATTPLIPNGYRIEWTEYKIEAAKNGNKNVSNYHIFAVDGLGTNWAPIYIATVSGTVTSYNLPTITNSMFVVGAEMMGNKTTTNTLALSNVVSNPLVAYIPAITTASTISIYPNPNTGTFTISAKGIISIYNVLGELISTEEIYGTTKFQLTHGIYMIKITDHNNTTGTQKVIIQ